MYELKWVDRDKGFNVNNKWECIKAKVPVLGKFDLHCGDVLVVDEDRLVKVVGIQFGVGGKNGEIQVANECLFDYNQEICEPLRNYKSLRWFDDDKHKISNIQDV